MDVLKLSDKEFEDLFTMLRGLTLSDNINVIYEHLKYLRTGDSE